MVSKHLVTSSCWVRNAACVPGGRVGRGCWCRLQPSFRNKGGGGGCRNWWHIPYLLAYKTPLRYKTPSGIRPPQAERRCKICMAHRLSTIVNPFAIRPPWERAFVSHGPHRGVLYASRYGSRILDRNSKMRNSFLYIIKIPSLQVLYYYFTSIKYLRYSARTFSIVILLHSSCCVFGCNRRLA